MHVAVESGYIGRSPCTERGASADEIPEMRFATAAQVNGLAAAVPECHRALVYVAAYSSPRFGELAGLRRRDVNPLHGTLTVAQQITEVRGQLHFGPPKTSSSRRTVRLPDIVMAALEQHMERYSEPGPDGLVFQAVEGGPLRRTNFRSRVWLPATKAVGVEGLRFHDLRHTGATLAAASGAPLKALMKRMGHSTVHAALRYQHVVEGQQEAIAQYLDEIARAAASNRDDASEAASSGTLVARAEADEEPDQRSDAVTRTKSSGASKNRTCDLILIRDAL